MQDLPEDTSFSDSTLYLQKLSFRHYWEKPGAWTHRGFGYWSES